MENSKIEWTHHTWNPWIGCTKVSDGCKHCYAETLAKGRMQLNVWGPTAERKARVPAAWNEPRRWDRVAGIRGERARVFCASLADVFEGPETCQNPDAYRVIEAGRAQLWPLIEQCRNLDWLLLTKRPENILQFVPERWICEGFPSNVWIGTSVEDQATADRRIPELLRVPAVVRFLSCEPLIGPVDLNRIPVEHAGPACSQLHASALVHQHDDCFYSFLRLINWVIVGGESGPKARPMRPDWAESLRDQCQNAGVAFHFKQWGEWCPAQSRPIETLNNTRSILMAPDGEIEDRNDASICLQFCREHRGAIPLYRFGKHESGRQMYGRTWDELPTPGGED